MSANALLSYMYLTGYLTATVVYKMQECNHSFLSRVTYELLSRSQDATFDVQFHLCMLTDVQYYVICQELMYSVNNIKM